MTEPLWTPTQYFNNLHRTLININEVNINKAIDIIANVFENDYKILTCGNGGSAAIAEHLTCDCMKGVATDTRFRPQIISLNSNVSVMTAIANDIGYGDVFARQVGYYGRFEDVLIAVSSSGNSPNIIKALKTAKELNLKTIAIVGFDAGDAFDLADVVIHIPSDNYGIVEDCSQAVMHYMAQHLRRYFSHKDPKDIKY